MAPKSVILFSLVAAIAAPVWSTAAMFVLVIDCSQSLNAHDRAVAAKEGAKLFAAILDDRDTLIVVGFCDRAIQKTFQLTTDKERQAAFDWIDSLPVEGGTDYLCALQAIAWPDGCSMVFISDGEHEAGPPQDVVKFAERELGKRIAIHSIAVGCKKASGAERLLQQMAAVTGGSFVRVEDSEGLVKQIVQTALKLGQYRSYSPLQSEIRLSARGRLFAFAYDGKPELTAQPTARQSRQHRASLPGGQVELRVTSLANPSDVLLRLSSPTSKHSRLGEIHRDDLPIAKIEIDAPSGKIAAGGTANVRIGFADRDGNVLDARKHAELSGKIAVVDEKGQVIARVPAQPSSDGPNLAASFTVPKDSGTITVHAKTIVRTPEGHDFSQLDAKTVAVELPQVLVTNPAHLEVSCRAGVVTRKLAVKLRDSPQLPDPLSVRMTQEFAGLTLVSADGSAGELTLTFSATEPGLYRGELLVSAGGPIFTTPAIVPFEFKVQKKFVGLILPGGAQFDFGKYPAGSGRAEIELQFNSGDEEPVMYTIHARDLASNNYVIPLEVDAKSIAPSQSTPAKLKASVDLLNVSAGMYTGRVTASTTFDGKPIEWELGVRLTVTEPLSADPIDLGIVEIGTIVDGTIRLSNLGSHRVSDISIIIPREFASPNGVATADVEVKLAADRIAVEAQAIRELPIKVAVSPLLKETGEFHGVLVVERGRTKALEVPIKLNVVPEGKGPAPFIVAPEALSADGKRGEVLEFLLRVKPTARLKSTQRLSIEVGQFQVDGQDSAVAADFKWIRGPELFVNGVAEVKLFVVTPRRTGVYRAQLIVRGESAGQLALPVEISVP